MRRSTLDPRLQALLDKQEIYQLVCAYCSHASWTYRAAWSFIGSPEDRRATEPRGVQ